MKNQRSFTKGGFYHIYNRGVHKEPVFLESFDYRYFLRLLNENAAKYDVKIVAYCLMRNHFHVLVRQLRESLESVPKLVGCTSMSYARYFNAKYEQVGCLFQGKYGSKQIKTDAYLLHVSRYIHNNPADFIDPLRYEWSSIQAYMHRREDVADPSYILKMLGEEAYTLA